MKTIAETIPQLAIRSTRILLLSLLPELCHAQWRTQTIDLQPGWNAVHLQVQPQPDDCDSLLAHQPIESVWKWDRRFSTVQFVTDPSTLLPEDPDWLVWLPPTSEKAFLRRLRSLQAHQSYLFKVADGAGPVHLAIKGQVAVPRLEWYPHGLNLVGFPVNPINPPTFTELFRFTREVDLSLGFANQLFRLDSQGRGIPIVQPNRDRVQPGVAYWMETRRKPAHIANLHLSVPLSGLDFGAVQFTKDLEILNAHLTLAQEVSLRLAPSEAPPPGLDFPELAGPVPLSYLSKDAGGSWEWLEFPAAGLTRHLGVGEKWTLRLGLRRDALPPYEPQGDKGATYQGIIELSDAAQSLLIPIPVSASVPATAPIRLLSAQAPDALAEFSSEGGLWVGSATLNQVNAPAYTGDAMIPTPAPMPLRLLVHVDNTGQARLLQEVLLAWDPTLTDEPHTNGTYALFAAESALPAGASQVRRISSIGFPVMDPVPLTTATNSVGADGLAGTVTIPFDDPTNPFLHRYHPMHDNKDWDFVAYTNAVEVPTIVRAIGLNFVEVTNTTAHPIWGVDAMAGTYSETITGLRAQPINLQGSFALQRISRLSTLQGVSP